jgi:hypothetical protein
MAARVKGFRAVVLAKEKGGSYVTMSGASARLVFDRKINSVFDLGDEAIRITELKPD